MKTIMIALVILLIMVFSFCNPWGDFDNPYDEEGLIFFNPMPLNKGGSTNLRPTLNWEDIPDADNYGLRWALSENDLQTSIIINVLNSEYEMQNALNLGDTVYWQIQPLVENSALSGWSEIWWFFLYEQFNWTIESSYMPTARSSPVTATVGTDIYTLGGHSTAGDTYSAYSGMRDNEVYHSLTDTWSQMAPIPYNRGAYGFTTAAINGKVFMFGGGNPPGTGHYPYVNVYDIGSDTWTADIATLPYPIGGATAVVYDGYIYIFGGRSGAESGSGQPYRKIAIKFDPVAYTYTNLSELPHFRAGGEALVIDGLIYLIGGSTATEASSPYGTIDNTPVIDVYDQSTDSWTIEAEIPMTGSPALVGNTVYLVSWDLSTVFKYNTSSDTWSSIVSVFDNPIGLSSVGCFGVVGNSIYALGGTGSSLRMDSVVSAQM